MPEANESLPFMDDIPAQANGPTEAELLDAVLKNSEFLEGSLPTKEIPEVDPSESDLNEDPEESEEVDNEDYEEVEDTEEEETEDEDAEEYSATQDADVFTLDDLDLDAKIAVKIDGEEVAVSFNDLIKGYSTEQSLSAKGRELGEARKQLETEREKQLQEINQLGQASAAVLYSQEQGFAKQYHDIEEKIKTARENGDTYELSDLKDKREQAQSNYWEARKTREGLVSSVEKRQAELVQKQWQEALEGFGQVINEYVPDFNEQVAAEIRDFALQEGLSEEVVGSIIDPTVVKFVNDYRKLKQGITKGEAKRKAAPSKKVPIKKERTSQKKKTDRDQMIKARAFKENASPDDHMAFLKQYASKSLNQ